MRRERRPISSFTLSVDSALNRLLRSDWSQFARRLTVDCRPIRKEHHGKSHRYQVPSGYRMTAIAPATSSHRKYRLPCFEIPRVALATRRRCLGTSPTQAARLRPDENAFQSPTSATKAVATIGPMPGISSSRRLSSHDRCQAWICFSMVLISAVVFAYCRARASRLNRAIAEMRSSSAFAMTSNSSAVPLRPLAEITPSSAICPRIAFDSIVR